MSKLTVVYVSLVECSERSMSIRTLVKIAEALNVTVDVLLWEAISIPDDLNDADRAICRRAKSIVLEVYGDQS